MAERAAFALKERLDQDSVGTVFVSDEGDLNVREALASGDAFGREGVLITDDPAQIAALDRLAALKRVSLQDAEAEPKKASVKSGGLSGSGKGGE